MKDLKIVKLVAKFEDKEMNELLTFLRIIFLDELD